LSRRRRRRLRFRPEFWLVCLFASVMPAGVTGSRRPIDLIVVASLFIFGWMVLNKRLPRPVVWVLAVYFLVLGVRVVIELGVFGDARTLLGMAATYVACVVFFVTREARISRRTINWLFGVGAAITLLSQMGILVVTEAYVSGTVDLSGSLVEPETFNLLAIDRFQDTTITVWRAFAVGLTFAAVVARTPLSVKFLGLLGLILQFGGGGGGRSALVFVVAAPIALVFFQGMQKRSRKVGRLFWAVAIAFSFAAVYYVAPVARTTATKEIWTHQERIMQVVVRPEYEEDSVGAGLSGRVATWIFFWEGITSSPQNFILGTGLSQGEAYGESALGQAHNIFLDVWGLTGVVGLVFMVVFLAYVFKDFKGLLSVAPARGPDQLVALALAGSVLFMVQWLMFQATASDRPFMTVFFLLAGLLAPVTRMIQDRRDERLAAGPIT